MRVSTNPKDSGYLSFAQDWNVMYNYEFVHDVVAADDVEGSITYITSERCGDDYKEKTLHGAVTLFNPFQDIPEDAEYVSLPGSLSSSLEYYDLTV